MCTMRCVGRIRKYSDRASDMLGCGTVYPDPNDIASLAPSSGTITTVARSIITAAGFNRIPPDQFSKFSKTLSARFEAGKK